MSSFIQVWKKTSSYRIKRFFEREMDHYAKLCPEGSPIWQARFFDFNIDTDNKFNEKIEYMHNNPVKAGLSESTLAWDWSSAKFYEQGEPVGVTLTPRA